MDPNSGRIYQIPTDMLADEAERRGLVHIPEADLAAVKAMSRQRRKTWAAERLTPAQCAAAKAFRAEQKARRKAARKARKKNRR